MTQRWLILGLLVELTAAKAARLSELQTDEHCGKRQRCVFGTCPAIIGMPCADSQECGNL